MTWLFIFVFNKENFNLNEKNSLKYRFFKIKKNNDIKFMLVLWNIHETYIRIKRILKTPKLNWCN